MKPGVRLGFHPLRAREIQREALLSLVCLGLQARAHPSESSTFAPTKLYLAESKAIASSDPR